MEKKADKEKDFSTDSGEFIPSYFTWQTLTGQKPLRLSRYTLNC